MAILSILEGVINKYKCFFFMVVEVSVKELLRDFKKYASALFYASTWYSDFSSFKEKFLNILKL